MTDEHLAKAVRAALENEPAIKLHSNPISISIDQGFLTLDGEVGEIAAKRLAPHRVMTVPGVNGVLDRLRVAPGEARGDGAILHSVFESLTQESAFHGYQIRIPGPGEPPLGDEVPADALGVIEVSVADGVVHLEGSVQSLTHKRLADVLAWWVPGSADVDNRLRVVPPEQDSDDEITDALRIVLEKDPWLDATQIRVHTENRSVRLEGLLHSKEQRNMAELDAWYILGVHKVVNQIEVKP